MPWVTFNRLFKHTGVVADLREMLALLAREYGAPVDIEFAVNFLDRETYSIHLLQCRTFQVQKHASPGAIEGPPPPGGTPLLEARGAVIGLGRSILVHDLLHEPFSSPMLDGPDRAPSRAMLYAVGFQKEDFSKPHIGIASTWSEVTPCNVHIDKLALESRKGADAAGGKGVIFNTITISDGISMGTEGMKYSLVSREVIADSIETVVGCEGMDGFVAIGGCDKNMPGCLMAMARMNRPAVFVYGGTILPGCATLKGEQKDLDIVSVFEAVGKHASGEYSDEELETVESCAIPGPGSCGGMYTANTMASAIEALGMSLPNSSAQAAISDDKMRDCFDAGAAVLNLIQLGIKPRDILTKEAFENAITVLIALGGSTNAASTSPPWPTPPGWTSPSMISSASANACRCSPTSNPPANT
jgi:hypothetical protein